MSKKANESGIFPGWTVVIAAFFVTMSLGEAMWSFGIFFKPLQAEFGWSRGLVSSAYTAFLLAYSLASIVAGRLSDRFGPRLVLMASGMLAGLGICLCSRTQSLNELRFFLMIAGLGAGGTWPVPTATVQRWFYGKPRAGLALGIVSSGIGIGAIVFTPLINYLILSQGWRDAFLIVGILSLGVIVAASLFIRESPKPVASGGGGAATGEAGKPELTTGKVLTQVSFLIITFAGCASISVSQFISVHMVPFATDLGISSTVAAAAVGLIGAVSIPGRVLSGPLADKIGWRRTLSCSLFGLAIAVVWTLFTQTEWMLYAFAVFFGLFWGIRVTAMNGIVGSFFGMRSVGDLIGITSAVANIAGAFVPYIAGQVFDSLGSYTMVFRSLALLLLVAGLLTMAIKKPAEA
ncbi:MAG: MFS transporter [Deltaproteobacteria bacterium]|nr:MFS transporter [Deltaproteobacteria bacterium]